MSMGVDPLRDVRGVGIEQYRAGMGEYLGAVASDAWASGPLSQVGRTVQASDEQLSAQARGDRLLTPEEASDQGRELGLRFDAPIAQGAYNVLANEKRRQVAAEGVFKRARVEDGYGTLSWLLGGGTEFLVQAADPLNLVASFVPVVGEARYAAMAARLGGFPAALAKGAIEGAAGQALLEPVNVYDRRQLGEDTSLNSVLTDVAFGGVLGAVLHGAGYGAGAGFRFMRDRYRVPDPAAPAREVAGAPGDLAPAREEPPTPSAVERVAEPAPRQPVAEAMEKLRPETKDAALKTAIAQLAQDKPVDVEPVLRADPRWPAVQAEIEKGHAEVPALQRQSTATQPLPTLDLPPDWRPAPDELRQAQRMARGWTPEKPEAAPLSLSEFVDRRGGVKAAETEASNLLAQDLKRLVRESGVSHDELARLAQEAGYRFAPDTRVGNGVDAAAFLNALIDDASGVRRVLPETEHSEAWRAQQAFFDAWHDYIKNDLGLEPRGMDPRRLAWLLSQDPDHARLLSLVSQIDKLGEGASLELAYRLDAERAALEREILAEEPGRLEPDEGPDHREVAAPTLDELERFYADIERTADAGEAGQEPLGEGPAGRRPDEGGQADAAGRAGRDATATDAGLRRAGEPGAEGPERTAAHLINKAIERYGLTKDIRKAGFVLPDGRMLDMSAGKDVRTLEHWDVRTLEGVNQTPDRTGLDDFMLRTGAARIDADPSRFAGEGMPTVRSNDGVLAAAQMPTRAQITELVRAVRRDRRGLFLDAVDGQGGHVAGTALERPTVEAVEKFFAEHFPERPEAATPSPKAEDLAEFAQRQAQADLHADPAGLEERDARLAGEARDAQQLLADDLKQYGHLIDDQTKAELGQVAAEHDATARAAEALAACIGGRP